MLLHPAIQFPPLPDFSRLRDLLWVSVDDLAKEGSNIRTARYLGEPFTGAAVRMDESGKVLELWEFRNGIQHGLHVDYDAAGQWLTCGEWLLGMEDGTQWSWDAGAQYVRGRQYCHAGMQICMQELDRFGAVLEERRNELRIPLKMEDPLQSSLACFAAVDVSYREDGSAHAACVVFRSPGHVLGEKLLSTHEVDIPEVAPYEPGLFFRRELPCILAVLQQVREVIDGVVVDGYVTLEEGHPGLGQYLHDALEGSVAVIGVAKTMYHGAAHPQVLRGESELPLFVGAVGMETDTAIHLVQHMSGHHRLPDMLRRADALSKGHPFQPA